MKSKLFATSLVTVFGLYGLLLGLLILIFLISGISLEYLLLVSIIVLLFQFLIAPFIMDLEMKWFYKIKFDYEVPEYLKNYITKIAEANKMKFPKIGFIDDGAPNAFTYGRTKNDARIILTRGVFELLTPEEVIAVVSHEMGHAVHYDMFLMTAVELVPTMLYYIYTVLVKNLNSDSDNKTIQALKGIGLIAYFLYLISQYIILWFSRTREYYADEFAVKTTGNPNSLGMALIKIGYGLTTTKNSSKVVNSGSAMGIFDSKTSKTLVITSYDEGKIDPQSVKKAAGWDLWNPWAKLYQLTSTHPLIVNRLKAIYKYCSTYNQQPFVEFDEKQPESYVDDFITEIFISIMPFLTIVLIIPGIIILNHVVLLGVNKAFTLFISFFLLTLSFLPSFERKYPNPKKINDKTTIENLLGEIKVSSVTAIPCKIEGTIIGKGDPGSIFDDDFTIKDETGIMFLNYNQPVSLWNGIFGLFKAKKYINQKVEITGWYRRSPVPYIEIYKFKMGDKTKKCHTYGFNKFWLIFAFIISIFLFARFIMTLL